MVVHAVHQHTDNQGEAEVDDRSRGGSLKPPECERLDLLRLPAQVGHPYGHGKRRVLHVIQKLTSKGGHNHAKGLGQDYKAQRLSSAQPG